MWFMKLNSREWHEYMLIFGILSVLVGIIFLLTRDWFYGGALLILGCGMVISGQTKRRKRRQAHGHSDPLP